jgi:hypothetical protein
MDWMLPGAFGLFFIVLFVSTIALVIVTLVDVVRMPNDASFKTGTQIVWVLVILLGGVIGAVVYLIVGRPPGGATAARQRPAVTAPPHRRPVAPCSAATLLPFSTGRPARWPNSRSIVSSTATRHAPPA